MRALARHHVVNKKVLSEADVCDLFIVQARQRAGWDTANRIRWDHCFPGGQVFGRRRHATHGERKAV